MTIHIRNAPASLRAKITALCEETYRAHREASPQDWPGNYFDLAIKTFIDQAFTDASGKALNESPNLFVAMNDGTFAGYYRLSDLPTDPETQYYAVEIQDIYVQPEFRGQGVARAMIEHAKGLADTHDWDSLDATVSDWNVGSRSLFESEGFTVKSRKLGLGPDRAARDIPQPATGQRFGRNDLFWLFVGAILMVSFLAAYLGR
ncbi:MAG: GNAT family N-acetyltransferase [Silicimonas sp.]|nr:GNAT family N-acetyltransferase [Silicimonas sp.]